MDSKNRESLPQRYWATTTMYVLGALIAILGLLVLFGWYSNQPKLIQVLPTFAPMQFNTAFCFLFVGIGILCLIRFRYVSAGLGTVVFLIALFTLLQYVFNTSFGIGQLAMKAYVTVRTSHPGRMAPNTALCFMLSGIVLSLYGYFDYIKTNAIISLIATLVMGVLGFAALLGYLSGLPTAYGWGSLTRMAVHTAVGFIIIAVALILRYVTFKRASLAKNSTLYPIAVIVVGFCLSFLLWYALYTNQRLAIESNISHEGRFASSIITKTLEQNIASMKRLFYRAEHDSYISHKSLLMDIDYYFNHFASLEAITIGGLPQQQPIVVFNKELPQLKGESYINLCRDSLSEIHQSVSSVQGLLCVRGNSDKLIAVVSLLELMKPILISTSQQGFEVQIFQGDKKIYGADLDTAVLNSKYTSYLKNVINVEGLHWDIKLYPNKRFFESVSAFFPNLFLIFCVVITLLLGYLVKLWQASLVQTDVLQESINEQKLLEENLNAIIESSKEAILIVNQKNKVIFCNRQAQELWQNNASNILGKKIEKLIEIEALDELSGFGKAGEAYEINISTSTGVTVPVQLRGSEVVYNKSPCLLFSLHDISERVASESRVAEQARNIQLIYDITAIVSDVDDIDKAYQLCLDIICQTLNFPIGHIYLHDSENERLQSSDIWFFNNVKRTSIFKKVTKSALLKKGQGVPGEVWTLQKPVWMKELLKDKTDQRFDLYKELDLLTTVAFPVMIKHEVIAVYELFSLEKLNADDKLLQAFAVMGQQIGRFIERKQAQDTLAHAESTNRLLLNSAGEGIYGLDIEGTTTFVNNAVKEKLGYKESDLLGKQMHNLIHYAHADGKPYAIEDCPMFAVLSDGKERRIYNEVLWKSNGSPLYVDYVCTPIFDDGALHGAVVIFNDISEKLRLEREKIEQEEFYQSAVNSVRDYAIIALDEGGNITFWNLGAEKIKGYTEAEVLGENFSRFYPKDVANTLPQELLKEAAKNGRVQHQGWRVRKNGKRFWADVVINALYDTDHKVKGYIKITKDLTDQKKYEEQLKKYSNELKKSNQDLDDFAYIASHDLKEPLRGISNMSSFLLEDYHDQLDNTGKDYLARLTKLCSRLEDFIDALLKYSRVGRLDLSLKQVSINNVLMEKIDLLDNFIKENNAEVNIAENMPTIVCDQIRIGEVFLNLITNGIKYNQSKNKKVDISVSEDGDNYTFCIKDNGIGISENNHEKIFKIFNRLHGRSKFGGGTGAGMTIVKKIVERHQGKIWVESDLNKGASFFFTISKHLKPTINKEGGDVKQ